ncbi:hypothetical protein [Actinocatenispora rupis]|uniref:Uncharacterized protein n=1 Tax=Actinocatenispora rupis TaxID=519421 RepID=A0A8J3NF99_9ACTN|nr:hypothetical protein [Actinocatenispora rupis]GID15022.1 hypothetical protein Aru02nite_59110 [Actinocatenispora rupis]
MTTYLFPVGFPLGLTYEPGGDVTTANAAVRIGDDFRDMSPGEYRIWLTAFTVQNRAQLEASSAEQGITDAPVVIDALLGLGLLTTLDTEAPDLPTRLAALRLVSLGIGLGNNAEQPGDWYIGGQDLQPRARVNFDVYTVWALSHRRTIQAACAEITEDGDDPLAVARNIVDNLPVLLGAFCAYLEPAA